MNRDPFAQVVTAPASESAAPRVARALSARELLSKLEGAERVELQRAMQARDLEAVRAMIAKHAKGAVIEADRWRPSLEAPNPMMRGGGGGARRRAFKPYADDEKSDR